MRLGRLTRFSYLLAGGVGLATSKEPSDMSAGLQDLVAAACREPGQLKENSIELDKSQVRDLTLELPGFLADVLLVQLDAVLHGLL